MIGQRSVSHEHRPFWQFWGLALVISWTIWIPILWSMTAGGTSPSFPYQALITGRWLDTPNRFHGLLLTIGLFGPLLAALFLVGRKTGAENLAAYIRTIFKWRAGSYWYGLVFALPLLINAAAMVTVVLVAGYRPLSLPPTPSLALFAVFLLWQILTSGMQEPAWRGYTLPLLEKRYTAEKASLITGFVWAIWHYPLIVAFFFDQGLLAILASLVGFTLTLIGWSFVLTWVFNATGSIWLCILLQGWTNTANTYLIAGFYHPLVPIIHAAVIWLLVVALLRTFGGKELSSRPVL